MSLTDVGEKLSDPQLWIFSPGEKNMLACSCKTQMLQFVHVIHTRQTFLQYVISHSHYSRVVMCLWRGTGRWWGDGWDGCQARDHCSKQRFNVCNREIIMWHFQTRLQQQNRTCSMRLWDISSRVRGNKARCFYRDVGTSPALIVARKQNILDKTSGLFQSWLRRKCPMDSVDQTTSSCFCDIKTWYFLMRLRDVSSCVWGVFKWEVKKTSPVVFAAAIQDSFDETLGWFQMFLWRQNHMFWNYVSTSTSG